MGWLRLAALPLLCDRPAALSSSPAARAGAGARSGGLGEWQVVPLGPLAPLKAATALTWAPAASSQAMRVEVMSSALPEDLPASRRRGALVPGAAELVPAQERLAAATLGGPADAALEVTAAPRVPAQVPAAGLAGLFVLGRTTVSTWMQLAVEHASAFEVHSGTLLTLDQVFVVALVCLGACFVLLLYHNHLDIEATVQEIRQHPMEALRASEDTAYELYYQGRRELQQRQGFGFLPQAPASRQKKVCC